MKKIFFSLLFFLLAAISFAQETDKREVVHPTYGADIERIIAIADINGERYQNVTVQIQAADLGGDKNFWRDDMEIPSLKGVKVIVRNDKGRKIFKKRFSKARLYVFSNGAMQIGIGNQEGNGLDYVAIQKMHSGYSFKKWYMVINEKGIFEAY